MTWSTAASGSITTTVGTEQTVTQQSGANTFAFCIDTSNLAVGEVVELRVYKILAGQTAQVEAWGASYASQSAQKLAQSPPIPSAGVTNGYKATVKQVSGSARTLPWELLSI